MIGNDLHSSTEAPVFKRDLVLEHLRTLIVTGELQPGRRMPTRSTVKSQFKTGSRLVDEAFDRLEEDGFVYTEPGHGTYVSEHPPHLSRYGIVLGSGSGGLFSAFTTALRRHIAKVEKARSCHFVFYENVTGHTDTLEYQELLRDIRSHRLAGLIFRADAFGEGDLSDSPVMTVPGIPRVLFSSDPQRESPCAGVTSVYCDDPAFSDRALDYLFERGRRRIAFLAGAGLTEKEVADFQSRAERRGMTAKRWWVLGLSLKQARQVTELLLSLPPGERPDGLVLATEPLIEPVGAGISTFGAEPGRDLDVVAYCDLPCDGPAPFPMRRLGIDMRRRLRVALDLLGRQRRDEAVPPHVLLSPVFEEELSRSAEVA